jgi:hypothetical protein
MHAAVLTVVCKRMRTEAETVRVNAALDEGKGFEFQMQGTVVDQYEARQITFRSQ